MKRLLALALASMLFSVSAQDTEEASPRGEGLIRGFVADYNAGNLDAMLEKVTEEITWLSTVGSISQVVTEGKDELREALTGQVEGPELRSEIVDLMATGDTVAVIEKAYWHQRGVTRSQCSMSVYQVKGGLIDSVMYFPSNSC